jgi:hypothetical protein
MRVHGDLAVLKPKLDSHNTSPQVTGMMSRRITLSTSLG